MAAAAPADFDLEEDPIRPLLLKLRRRDKLSDHEATVLRQSVERVETCGPNERLVTAGEPLTYCTLLVQGFVARHKDLAGGQRQITDWHVPGDVVDLHGFLLKRLEHHVSTLTPARIAFLPHQALTRITEREPHLGRLLWLSTLMDAALQRERLLSIGRRSALSRVAHLLCELYARLEVVEFTEDRRFRLPVTQIDLADASGLTSVHVNRMLRQLRDRKLVTFRNGMVDIHDLPQLEALAEFERSFLFLDAQPR